MKAPPNKALCTEYKMIKFYRENVTKFITSFPVPMHFLKINSHYT